MVYLKNREPTIFYRGFNWIIFYILIAIGSIIGSYFIYRDNNNQTITFWLFFLLLSLGGFVLLVYQLTILIRILSKGSGIKRKEKTQLISEYSSILNNDTINPYLKWCTIKAISKFRIQNAYPFLIELLYIDEENSSNRYLIPIVLRTLGIFGEKKAIPDLLEFLNFEINPYLRSKAVWALGEIGKKSINVLKTLFTLLKYENNHFLLRQTKSAINKIVINYGFCDYKDFQNKYDKFEQKETNDNLSENQLIILRSFSSETMESYFGIGYDNELFSEFEQRNIQEIVNSDESEFIEFKSSLRWDIDGHVNIDLEFNVMLAISSFLNTNGGILVLGLTDKKQIIGIEKDYNKVGKNRNPNGYETYFNNRLRECIGTGLRQFIRLKFEKYQNNDLCLIIIPNKSKKPIFVKDRNKRHFFAIREGNETTVLDAKDTVFYIKENWPDFLIS